MIDIKKSGQNQYGVWLIGIVTLGGLEISGIFSTNLTEIPKEDKLKPKKVRIASSKKGFTLYRLEF